MQITFKLYATLVDYLPAGTQGHAVSVDIAGKTTVQQVIEQFRIPEQLAFLVMLNGVYVAPEERLRTYLQAQDTLAVWPKVAGG